LRPRTEALSWLKAGMVWQGWNGIGELYQSVPAYAGLRRFYSCAICYNGVPPSMPLARHILVTISESLYTVYMRSNDEVINGTG
ncbi:hypothetical protein AAIH24_33395, partial [Pseudomonas aeruginosa]|uniref:hypothetical protein n=1 Tax=Pseudomonas aeruginosa TaxID=287 RepID=UPI0031B67145